AQASIRFFEELDAPLFEQVGYLFLATTEEGLAELEERRELQAGLGVPVERVNAGDVEGLYADDVLGAEVREGTAAETLDADVLVIACGPWSADLAAKRGVELPIRPLCRQLIQT